MSTNLLKFNSTGTGLLQFDVDVPRSSSYRLVSVTIHLNAAPTTSEDYTITLDPEAGAAYRTLLYTLDLSAAAVTDLVWQPDEEIILTGDDQIEIRYDNTDVRLYGVQVTMKAV